MRGTCLLVAGLAFVIVVAEVSANCLCGVTGEDYCSCKTFRPIPKLFGKFAGPKPKLLPIGDRCWCGKQLVEPAIPPKLCCPKKLPKVYVKPTCNSCGAEKVSDHSTCSCSCSCGCGCGCASKYPVPEVHQPRRKCSGLPADPVSVSLAYQMDSARKCAIPESKLQYGFRTKPLNAIQRQYSSNCPEEDLYALRRQIIELKKSATSNQEEEIFEEESEEESDVGPDPSYLTYGELGYCPEKFKGGKFIGVSIKTPDLPAAIPPPICDCGFKPGSIVPYNTKEHKFNYGNCFDDDDDDDDDDDNHHH